MARDIQKDNRCIGELLLLCREMKGKSQRAVAADTGISCPFICQVEQGRTSLGFKNAVILADYYGIKIERMANIVRQEKPNDQR